MTLLGFNGFDSGELPPRFWYAEGSNSFTTSTRSGQGRALVLGTTGFLVPTLPFTASAEIYTGSAVYMPTMDTALRGQIALYTDGGGSRQISVAFSTAGVTLVRGGIGGTIIAASQCLGVVAATWFYVEIWLKVHPTTGRCIVRVNGRVHIDYTGNTTNGGVSANIDQVAYQANGLATWYDDIYVCNSLGSAPFNTFLGDVRVATLPPSGAGTTTGMTASTGANYTCVDELPYSATDYVVGGTGTKDTYAMTDLASGNVLAVQPTAIAKTVSTGGLRTVLRSAGTDYTGATVTLGATDKFVGQVYETDPATSTAWTRSNVNALEAGVEVV